MTGDGCALAGAAQTLVGSPFRLHGRDPVTGIDCIGLVACAMSILERPVPPIPHYALRNLAITPFKGLFAEAGFVAASGKLQAGDLLLLKPSPGQFHLAIAADDARLIQAHAGIGRVVISPAPALADVFGHWHLT